MERNQTRASAGLDGGAGTSLSSVEAAVASFPHARSSSFLAELPLSRLVDSESSFGRSEISESLALRTFSGAVDCLRRESERSLSAVGAGKPLSLAFFRFHSVAHLLWRSLPRAG